VGPLLSSCGSRKEYGSSSVMRTEEQIDDFFESLVFTQTALSADDTYQGVLFFSMPRASKRRDTTFMISTLFREGGPKVRVGVTQPQTASDCTSDPSLFRCLKKCAYWNAGFWPCEVLAPALPSTYCSWANRRPMYTRIAMAVRAAALW
jgi:hypothetical protein